MRQAFSPTLVLTCAALMPALTAHAANITVTGTVNYGANNTWSPGSTVTDNGGHITFSTDTGSDASAPLSVILNSGTVNFTSTQHLNALTINGGKATLSGGPLKTSSLPFASSSGAYAGTLDLTAQPAIVEPTASTKATVFSALQAEITYGKTHTTGILSSTLATNMTIALVDNAAFGQTTFRGVAVDTNSLLVVPALLGDTNLDGKVDLSDLNTVLNNLGTTNANFTSGNFDGAPTIDLTDLNDVLNNLGAGSANPGAQTADTSLLFIAARPDPNVTLVPEPASLLLTLPLATLLLHRRRL
jgi:hypothetical protein